jgi:ribosomal protein S18 acetylase RimI-like enzyme
MIEIPTITLRAASSSDLAFLKELRRASMWKVLTKHYPWVEETELERVLIHFESARIIGLGDKDIGLFKVVYGAEHVHLSQIQLLPECQGRGIGSRLISDLQEEVGLLGLSITLNVFRSNTAIDLYLRLGFRIHAEDRHSFTMIWNSTSGAT